MRRRALAKGRSMSAYTHTVFGMTVSISQLRQAEPLQPHPVVTTTLQDPRPRLARAKWRSRPRGRPTTPLLLPGFLRCRQAACSQRRDIAPLLRQRAAVMRRAARRRRGSRPSPAWTRRIPSYQQRARPGAVASAERRGQGKRSSLRRPRKRCDVAAAVGGARGEYLYSKM